MNHSHPSPMCHKCLVGVFKWLYVERFWLISMGKEWMVAYGSIFLYFVSFAFLRKCFCASIFIIPNQHIYKQIRYEDKFKSLRYLKTQECKLQKSEWKSLSLFQDLKWLFYSFACWETFLPTQEDPFFNAKFHRAFFSWIFPTSLFWNRFGFVSRFGTFLGVYCSSTFIILFWKT